ALSGYRDAAHPSQCNDRADHPTLLWPRCERKSQPGAGDRRRANNFGEWWAGPLANHFKSGFERAVADRSERNPADQAEEPDRAGIHHDDLDARREWRPEPVNARATARNQNRRAFDRVS